MPAVTSALRFWHIGQISRCGDGQVDLVPNGSNIAVTASNRIAYIHRVAYYRLNVQIQVRCSGWTAIQTPMTACCMGMQTRVSMVPQA